VAEALDLPLHLPDLAEVISAVGDALSLVRVERERSATDVRPADEAALAEDAERAAVEAGARADTVDVLVELDTDRHVLRAIATGMVGLQTGALPGRIPLSAAEATDVAARFGAGPPRSVGHFWLATGGDDVPVDRRPTVVLDRHGDAVAHGHGALVLDATTVGADHLADVVARCTRRRGPVTTPPTTWVVHGNRATQAPPVELAAAVAELSSDRDPVAAVVLCG
jgi:hypothetical protein